MAKINMPRILHAAGQFTVTEDVNGGRIWYVWQQKPSRKIGMYFDLDAAIERARREHELELRRAKQGGLF